MSRGSGFSIIKRKRGGRELSNFQVRVQVPAHMQGAVGQAEVLRSLKTGDRRTASLLAPRVVADLHEEWRALVGGENSLIGKDPKAVAVQVAYDSMLIAMEERRREWPDDHDGYAAKLAEWEAELRRLTRRLDSGDLASWESMADRAITKRGLSIRRGGEGYRMFVRDLAEASIDALRVFLRRSHGEIAAAPQTDVVQAAKARSARVALPGETLLDHFEAWAAEKLQKGEKRPDTVAQDRKVIQQFARFVGADRCIRSISAIEVAEYRDTLRDLPPKWMSKRELRDLDMRHAAARARELNLPKSAYTNVNKHLSTISPLYKWLAKQPKWAGLLNPVTGLFHDKVKGRNPRPPFTTETLNRILSSPLFVGFEADGREHVPGSEQADDWRFWVPIACLFTGARVGEIAQLQIGDVALERGVWFIHIRHDELQGLSTKSGKARVAAVHPILQRIGFVAYRERQLERAGRDETAPLFPELEPNARGQISGMASRWWRDYLRRIGVKDAAADGGDGHGSHSFRHTLADRLRSEAELLDNQIAVCLGHSTSTTTSRYGTLSQGTVGMLKGWMDAVRFDGVSFEHLVTRESSRSHDGRPAPASANGPAGLEVSDTVA